MPETHTMTSTTMTTTGQYVGALAQPSSNPCLEGLLCSHYACHKHINI